MYQNLLQLEPGRNSMFFLSGGEVLQVLRHCLAGTKTKKKKRQIVLCPFRECDLIIYFYFLKIIFNINVLK